MTDIAKSRSRTVLLLALSGVRIRNRELQELGMTLPGFVERGKVIASLPSLGLLTLAAHTPEPWAVEYRDLDEISETDIASIVDSRPDLVAVSSLTCRIREAYRLTDTLRREGIRTVLGGLHVTACPDEAAQHADAIVIGAGEAAWEELLQDFEKGSLRPRYRKRFDLRESRVPRFDLLDLDRYNRITIQTARGCPLDCSFCGASRLLGPFQTKPIEFVRREIEAILSRWPKPFLELADDNTFSNKRWARELLRLFCEYRLRWFTETDLSVADDPEILELLARSGCAQVLIGFESVRAESLHDLDSRRWKYSQRAAYLEKIARIQSAGISVNGCFVLGFDEDGPDIFDRTLEFVRESALSEVQITVLTPFPGTRLHSQLAQSGRLPDPAPWDGCSLFDVVYEPRRMSADELSRGFRDLAARLYDAETTAERKRRFRSCIRAQRRRHD